MSAPWLDYTGQSPAELLACRDTHRHDSILAAFATALRYKRDTLGKRSLSANERMLLAVSALDAEVNNGGFDQFFRNSSHKYAPTVLAALRKLGCTKTAAVAAKAIDALGLQSVTAKAVRQAMDKRSSRRDRVLDECDEEFYALTGADYEIESKLMAFVTAEAAQFSFAAGYEPPGDEPAESGTGYSAISSIQLALELAEPKDLSTAALLKLARATAAADGDEDYAPATEAEIRAGVALYQYCGAVERRGDPRKAEPFAATAFDLARQETAHMVAYFEWIEKLVKAGHAPLADAWLLKYVDYLPHTGADAERMAEDGEFWADIFKGNRAKLPQSSARFKELFPPHGRK